MPVRKLKKSYQNVTGRVYSGRLHRSVQFDSLLEREFIDILNLHPAVRAFEEQPMKIGYVDENGNRQVYVPDFYVRFKGGEFLGRKVNRPWIVETKYRSDLHENWQRIKPKLRAGFRVAVLDRCTFRVVSESILNGPVAKNVKFLKRFINAEPHPDLTSMILAQVWRQGTATSERS